MDGLKDVEFDVIEVDSETVGGSCEDGMLSIDDDND